eukprot:5762332-Prymnesium_polylepis.1
MKRPCFFFTFGKALPPPCIVRGWTRATAASIPGRSGRTRAPAAVRLDVALSSAGIAGGAELRTACSGRCRRHHNLQRP